MVNLWRKTQAFSACLQSLYRIAKQHGVIALRLDLSELEEKVRDKNSRMKCTLCGSTDLEPTATTSSRHGMTVSKLRCKACGQEFTPD